MNGMSHMKYMLLGGVGLFGVLLLFGVPLQSALLLAALLACPLMMVFMLGGDHSRHGMAQSSHDHAGHRASQRSGDPSAMHRHT
jgi:hypothetical protein